MNVESSTFQHYIKRCVWCINTFQFTAFPSQQVFALITRETRRKMGWLETGKGITKPNSVLHNALWGHSHAGGALPDELILNNKCYSAKRASVQYPLCTLRHGWAHSNQHPHSQPCTHYHKLIPPFISSTRGERWEQPLKWQINKVTGRLTFPSCPGGVTVSPLYYILYVIQPQVRCKPSCLY